ncbi:unnamed protein product [Ambrosiozyma monospora]|uniref:Unnamed protein product n=1 Tax=Ambrosiozyma monospora TaxID=43982 RepID=A0A9W6YXK3_AMBMO|nr:unnamed protein product [Ambrosiozyma monospora]
MKGQFHHFAFFAKEKIEYGIKRYHDETFRLIGVLEERLKRNGTGYLVGDHLSLADIACFPWLRMSGAPPENSIDNELKAYPLVLEWLNKINKLDAVPRAQSIPPWSLES